MNVTLTAEMVPSVDGVPPRFTVMSLKASVIVMVVPFSLLSLFIKAF